MPPERALARIGINALFLLPGQIGGAEIYVRSLLRAVARIDDRNRYFVYRNAETGPDLVPGQPNFVDRPQPVHAASRPARIAYEQTRLIGAIVADRLDVLLNTGFTAPLFAPVPMATIFYDLQYLHHPECFRKIDLAAWHVLLPLSARRSRRVIAMSQDARSDLSAAYPWTRDEIDLVPHGIDDDFVAVARKRDASDGGEPLLLCVSALRAHKNLEKLLQAFARFRECSPAYRLVVVGPRDQMADRLESLRDELGLHDAVTFTGWIERDELLAYFARARALVFPSRFEGFGIPVLEALAAHLPLACSDIAPAREVAGDAAAYFDPEDVAGIARALERVTSDAALRRRLIADGDARARRFTWEASATTLVETLTTLGRARAT